MQVAVGVPEREYAVACLALRDFADSVIFHQRIFSIDVVEYAWMNKGVVKSGIENFLISLGASFDLDSGKIGLPRFSSCFSDCFEVGNTRLQGRLLGI